MGMVGNVAQRGQIRVNRQHVWPSSCLPLPHQDYHHQHIIIIITIIITNIIIIFFPIRDPHQRIGQMVELGRLRNCPPLPQPVSPISREYLHFPFSPENRVRESSLAGGTTIVGVREGCVCFSRSACLSEGCMLVRPACPRAPEGHTLNGAGELLSPAHATETSCLPPACQVCSKNCIIRIRIPMFLFSVLSVLSILKVLSSSCLYRRDEERL